MLNIGILILICGIIFDELRVLDYKGRLEQLEEDIERDKELQDVYNKILIESTKLGERMKIISEQKQRTYEEIMEVLECQEK